MLISCKSVQGLPLRVRSYDHIILGFKHQGASYDEIVINHIEISDELKGDILCNNMSFSHESFILKESLCIRYSSGWWNTSKPQSFMLIKENQDDEFREETLLFFNESLIDTTLKVTFEMDNLSDNSNWKALNCYNLNFVRVNRISAEKFNLIKNRLNKRFK
jgi:hypothetical protein